MVDSCGLGNEVVALYTCEQQSAFYAKAGLNWHQVCIINKEGKTDGMVQLLPEAKETCILAGFQLVCACSE